jgi:DnaJ-class molecular chaperone
MMSGCFRGETLWEEKFRVASAAKDFGAALALLNWTCERCSGQGEMQVGCAMVRPIVWRCADCEGTGFNAKVRTWEERLAQRGSP